MKMKLRFQNEFEDQIREFGKRRVYKRAVSVALIPGLRFGAHHHERRGLVRSVGDRAPRLRDWTKGAAGGMKGCVGGLKPGGGLGTTRCVPRV